MSNEKIKSGDLVVVFSNNGIFGTLPKCWIPDNWEKTITPADNIHIPKNSVGIVIEEISLLYHTTLVNVVWFNFGGMTLTVPTSRILKIILDN